MQESPQYPEEEHEKPVLAPAGKGARTPAAGTHQIIILTEE